jgi:hypothetical protein
MSDLEGFGVREIDELKTFPFIPKGHGAIGLPWMMYTPSCQGEVRGAREDQEREEDVWSVALPQPESLSQSTHAHSVTQDL